MKLLSWFDSWRNKMRISQTFNGFEDAKKHCNENKIEPTNVIVIWEVSKVKGD